MPRFGKPKEKALYVVAVARIDASPADRTALIATIARINEAANWLAVEAFRAKCADYETLQKQRYAVLRARFGLSSQTALGTVAKVAGAYKRDLTIQPVFRAHGAVAFDPRVYSVKSGVLSIRGLDKRISGIPLRIGPSAKAWLAAGQWKEADLILRRDGKLMLAITVALPVPPAAEAVGTLGIDLGIVNLAVDSDGEVFSGAGVEKVRRHYLERRRSLQQEKAARSHKNRALAAKNKVHAIKKKTRSLRKKLRSLGNREARFRRNENHCISKKIVAKAQGTQRRIALEDLKGISAGVTVRHEQSARHKGWAYAQLRSDIEYKAARLGIAVLVVPPRGTSTTCLNPACRHRDKRNRKSRDVFLCVRCGFTAPADLVGAANVSLTANVMWPIVPRDNPRETGGDACVAPESPRSAGTSLAL